MKISVAACAAFILVSSAAAFTPAGVKPSPTSRLYSAVEEETSVKGPIIVDKPSGTSFLPQETVERCEKGNPTEKVKLKGDPIHAWVDIYEYARKIREGEMTWKDMEKADIDTVSPFISHFVDKIRLDLFRILWGFGGFDKHAVIASS